MLKTCRLQCRVHSLTETRARYFGRWGNGGGYRMTGLIDDIRIYNRALSADEISLLYNE
jgi:hypothetical protein